MKYIKILLLSFFIFMSGISFADNVALKNDDPEITRIEREDYEVRLKQYGRDYPLVLYVVFSNQVPLLGEIQKILISELRTIAKTLPADDEKTVIIASAWYDDQVSADIEKIELSTSNSSFVWVSDKKEEKHIKSFPGYIKYLKEKMKKDTQSDMQIEESPFQE